MLGVMTDPQFGPSYDDGSTPPPQSSDYLPPPIPDQYPPPPAAGQYPPPGAYPPPGVYPPPGAYPGAYPAAYDPAAPFGRNVITGEPLSDKSKVVAGLLQLIGLVGLLGFGRIYLGQTGLGVAQLVIGLAAIVLSCFTVGWAVPVIWAIVDAILIFSDKVRDPQGRPLRDGT